eukprot:4307135-Pleurochrysis_carterae.AAC.2
MINKQFLKIRNKLKRKRSHGISMLVLMHGLRAARLLQQNTCKKVANEGHQGRSISLTFVKALSKKQRKPASPTPAWRTLLAVLRRDHVAVACVTACMPSEMKE